MSGELHPLAAHPHPGRPSGTLLFCRECGVAHKVSDPDRAPFYGDDGESHAMDDERTFLRAHGSHAIGMLTRSGDAEVRSGPRWDPMVRTTFEATDGAATWIVVAEREDVSTPRRYWVRPGHLELAEESVSLDESLLREVVDDALSPYAASESLLESIVARVRDGIEQVPIEAFEVVDEDRHEPDVALAGLPPQAIERLRGVVETLLPIGEARRVTDVAERELRAELPVVRVRRRYAAVPLR